MIKSTASELQNETTHSIQQALLALPELAILAVDDVDINLILLSSFLEDSNIQLTTVTSGKAALTLCNQHEYDLILMDIQMPDMDGIETTQYIRKTDNNIGTPIIALTAHTSSEDINHILSSGLDDYLTKPIILETLIKLIQTWCVLSDTPELIQNEGIPEAQGNLPSVDWELALRKANFNHDAARELLSKFVIMLPEMMLEIQEYYLSFNINGLLSHIHTLHGACCYTGVPGLQSRCFDIESMLKKHPPQTLDNQIELLVNEADNVLENAQELLDHLQID